MALMFISVLQVSAQFLKPVNEKDSPFGNDLYVFVKSNDDINWLVDISFTDHFDFREFPGVGVNIGGADDKDLYFSSTMPLRKNNPKGVAPGGLGLNFGINSKTLEKSKFTFEPEYKKKPVTVTLQFVMRDGRPIGYEVNVVYYPVKAEQDTEPTTKE